MAAARQTSGPRALRLMPSLVHKPPFSFLSEEGKDILDEVYQASIVVWTKSHSMAAERSPRASQIAFVALTWWLRGQVRESRGWPSWPQVLSTSYRFSPAGRVNDTLAGDHRDSVPVW